MKGRGEKNKSLIKAFEDLNNIGLWPLQTRELLRRIP